MSLFSITVLAVSASTEPFHIDGQQWNKPIDDKSPTSLLTFTWILGTGYSEWVTYYIGLHYSNSETRDWESDCRVTVISLIPLTTKAQVGSLQWFPKHPKWWPSWVLGKSLKWWVQAGRVEWAFQPSVNQAKDKSSGCWSFFSFIYFLSEPDVKRGFQPIRLSSPIWIPQFWCIEKTNRKPFNHVIQDQVLHCGRQSNFPKTETNFIVHAWLHWLWRKKPHNQPPSLPLLLLGLEQKQTVAK